LAIILSGKPFSLKIKVKPASELLLGLRNKRVGISVLATLKKRLEPSFPTTM
jgi:hypothetical protein